MGEDDERLQALMLSRVALKDRVPVDHSLRGWGSW